MKAFKNRPSAARRSRLPRILLIVGIVIIIGILGTIFTVRRIYTENLRPVNSSAHTEIVVAIPAGSSLDEIADALKSKNAIRADWAFKQYVRSHELGDELKAGTYRFYTDQDVASVVDDLVAGRVAVDLFTILPGQRLDQIRQAFIDKGFAASEVDAALNPDNYKGHPALVDKPTGASLEGYLYPDSFQKTAETAVATVITSSLDEMAGYLTADLRSAYAAEGLTTYQGIILASIVEQEVSNGSDRPTVAQVFLKRYKTGMMLGSDVTACYGAIVAGAMKTGDNCNDFVQYDTPYNTRIHTGLPSTPISNVSKSGLEAVAHPAQTDYLYFVAGDDGVTYFSKTYEEHQALTAEHCKKLCQ